MVSFHLGNCCVKNSFFLVTKPLRCRVVAHPAPATDSERSHKGERGHGGVRGGAPSWRPRMVAVPRPSVVAAMTTATKPGIFPDGMGGIHAFPWDLERGHTLAAGTWDSERHTRLVRVTLATPSEKHRACRSSENAGGCSKPRVQSPIFC